MHAKGPVSGRLARLSAPLLIDQYFDFSAPRADRFLKGRFGWRKKWFWHLLGGVVAAAAPRRHRTGVWKRGRGRRAPKKRDRSDHPFRCPLKIDFFPPMCAGGRRKGRVYSRRCCGYHGRPSDAGTRSVRAPFLRACRTTHPLSNGSGSLVDAADSGLHALTSTTEWCVLRRGMAAAHGH